MPENVKCNGCYHLRAQWCRQVLDSPDPDRVRICNYFRQKNNADRIRAMDDEELGKFLMQAHDGALEIPFCKDNDECFDDIDAITNAKCMACMMAWLQQPAEEG